MSKYFHPETLKKDAAKVLSFIEKYHATLDQRPVQPEVQHGFLRHSLEKECPQNAKPLDAIL